MAFIGIEVRGLTWNHFGKPNPGFCGLRRQAYFANEGMECKTLISGEKPHHARCRGEKNDNRGPDKSDYDGDHRCSSYSRVDSIIKHLNEREAGG